MTEAAAVAEQKLSELTPDDLPRIDYLAEEAEQGLEPVLGEPEYTGDIETALIHHLMPREAFRRAAEGRFERVFALAGSVTDRLNEGGRVLALLGCQVDTGTGPSSDDIVTAFIESGSKKPPFHSTVEHKQDLERDGIPGNVAVTSRVLTLLTPGKGKAVTVEADLTGLGKPEDQKTRKWTRENHSEGLVLSTVELIDPTNGDRPLTEETVSTSQREVRRLHPAVALFDWARVAERVVKGIQAAERGGETEWPRFSTEMITARADEKASALGHVLKAMEFFEEIGQLDYLLKAEQRNRFENLEGIFENAKAFEHSLDRIGQRRRGK